MPQKDFEVRSALANQGVDLSSRDKLVDSARELFSAKGFREVSVREIATHAGVNSALVGYYFRGKQALFNEVYRSFAAPLAEERMRRLKELLKQKQKPVIEDILKAWIVPWLQSEQVSKEGAVHLRITANLSSERWEHTNKAAPFMLRTHNAFISALQDCLPYLSRKTVTWRLHFLVGAIAFGLRDPNPLLAVSQGDCDPTNLKQILAQILPYTAAGLSAPEPEKA
jgi:AcrR family transcriptional regulator